SDTSASLSVLMVAFQKSVKSMMLISIVCMPPHLLLDRQSITSLPLSHARWLFGLRCPPQILLPGPSDRVPLAQVVSATASDSCRCTNFASFTLGFARN